MKRVLLTLAVLFTLHLSRGEAAPPVVSNIRAAQIAGTKNVEILYDVSDADGGTLTIGLAMSGDGGLTYSIPATALSGHIGPGVAPGFNRRIVWNAGADWNGQYVPNARARVTAFDGTTPPPPPGMVYIPAGSFQMGDNLDNDISAMPVHHVYVDAFFMDRFEVSKELWLAVQTWGAGRGYSITTGSSSSGSGRPITSITWYDAVAWCNARSEKEGLTPCYYINDNDWRTSTVYRDRSATSELENSFVDWTANGYRLPTEAEWEKAARGGSLGLRYPWGDTIGGGHANYNGSGDPYDNDTTPVGYYNGNHFPPGPDMANGYGLYDMAGNLNEWCWDRYSSAYYSDSAAFSNPRGPATTALGNYRIFRGGAFDHPPLILRCADRRYNDPTRSSNENGVRTVRGR